ncbi:ankyrin repeat domain-containing 12 [Paramuricea clavata]|uniref:Ankyrin repeat domain-containing 12 n=1 Tax=Paramuricea clavata TaxID=317549 RepID=A0A6S7HRP3_PARCT|nr:ankyrin repeat domain-containing 12 [Paramuricea clavata]
MQEGRHWSYFSQLFHVQNPIISMQRHTVSELWVLFFIVGAVNYILRCQCDANARNKQGFTPLHLAASVGSIHLCQCLLEGGADMNCINTQCKNEIYKFLTPLDLAKLNKHSECVEYLEDNGGFRGDEITKLACRKIQRWWRRHRAPKTTLDPVEEYHNDCLKKSEGATCLEITQRASEDDTNCLTKTQDKDEQREHNISEHKKDNGLQQLESTSERRRTLSNSSRNIPIEINVFETKRLSVPGVHSNELKTRTSKNSKNKAQKQSHEMLDDLHKSKSKTSLVNRAAVGPVKYTRCVKNPTRKSPSTARNATVKETRHALKTKIPGDNRKLSSASLKQVEGRECKQETSKQATAKQERPYTLQQTECDVKPSSISRKQAEGREDIQTTSKLETPCTTKEDLKRALDVEILRKEKLSKEIARLKKNLEERSQSLEMRLGVIEKNLKKL